MSEGTNITIAGDWAKPAQTLIERISDAIGGGLKPWQIRRTAKADADAAVIKAEGEQRAKELLAMAGLPESAVGQRAVQRMVASEVRKQVNIESVTRLALENLDRDAKPEELDQDFLIELLEGASKVSNEDMQTLWASILAGEANKPGSFSKRTLKIVSELNRSEAELFSRICSTVWKIGDSSFMIAPSAVLSELFPNDSHFNGFVELESIGLIKENSLTGLSWSSNTTTFPSVVPLEYFGREIYVRFLKGPAKIALGNCVLTSSGQELAKISGAVFRENIFSKTLNSLMQNHVEIYSPLPDQSWAAKFRC